MADSLGDRMKEKYERPFSYTIPGASPVVIRVDGKAFHTYTKGCDRPFDQLLIDAMWETAKVLCAEIQNAQVAFAQSDEISILLHNYKTIKTESWFDNKIQKMASVAAGIASGVMTEESPKIFGEVKRACFDARVFFVPPQEVCNYFIWRQKDWTRNSVQMLARSLFSHKQCQGKNNSELQEMCFQQGRNWNDLPVYLRRGACVVRRSYSSPHPHAPTRHRWEVDKDIPIFTQDRDYVESYLETDDE